MNGPDRIALRIGAWRVDPLLDEVSRDGEVVKLEPRTMRVLLCLAENAGQVVSIQELLDKAWADVIVTPDSVYQSVATLRRTLGDDTKEPTYIANVPRRGYRMVASVAPWVTVPVQSMGEPSEGTVPVADRQGSGSLRNWLERWPRTSTAAAMALIGIVAAGGFVFVRHQLTASSLPSDTSPHVAGAFVLAVLPFQDLSEKKDQDYLADGLADELIDVLSRLPATTVIGRVSSFQFKGRNDDLVTIGHKLGAGYILSGSVRTAGTRLRVTAQLNAAADGTHLWSESYDRDSGDALRIEDEIATDVARTFAQTFDSHMQGGRQASVSPEAFGALLRGLQDFYRFDREGLAAAPVQFQRALDLAPGYGRAAAMLAVSRMVQASFGFGPSREGFESARTAAMQSLQLTPDWPDAHTVLASIHLTYDWDWSATAAELQRSRALEPQHAITLQNAAMLEATLGRWDESIRLNRMKLRADPFEPSGYFILGSTLYRAGRLAEAEAATREGIKLGPTYVSGHYYLGKILLVEGHAQEALAQMLKEVPEGAQFQGLAMAYHSLGRQTESDAALEAAINETGHEFAFDLALALAVRGERDRAFEWLERAYAQRDAELYIVKGEPLLQSIASDPRYAAFLRKMKLLD
jgi:TolB-like protein/DNA-binding winged helix-turn-helix (wHTH) protein/tetratricopeptide (TPR) repeat protein